MNARAASSPGIVRRTAPGLDLVRGEGSLLFVAHELASLFGNLVKDVQHDSDLGTRSRCLCWGSLVLSGSLS